MKKNSKIFVAGGTGLVGSAIIKKLIEKGYTNIISNYHKRLPTTNYPLLTFIQLDLLNQNEVKSFFEKEKPEYVILAAAKVGGIVANNTYRADFIYENLQIQNNVIHQSYLSGVKKLLFLGSTCIYPKNAPQPMKEEYLLTSELEYTNEPYAIAKIAGIKMCESYNIQYGTNFISVMPTNLYGENDNFDLETSHVLPALIRKIHLGKALENNNWEIIKKDLDKRPIESIDGSASEKEILSILNKFGIKVSSKKLVVSSKKENTTHYPLPTTHSVKIEIWGSGKPRREFLYSEDMADACVYLMEKVDVKDIVSSEQLVVSSKKENTTHSPLPTPHFLNIGTGVDVSIEELALSIKKIVGYEGELYFNTSKPDGTMVKLTDPSKLHALGWRHEVELEEGIAKVYEWYLSNK